MPLMDSKCRPLSSIYLCHQLARRPCAVSKYVCMGWPAYFAQNVVQESLAELLGCRCYNVIDVAQSACLPENCVVQQLFS